MKVVPLSPFLTPGVWPDDSDVIVRVKLLLLFLIAAMVALYSQDRKILVKHLYLGLSYIGFQW